MKKPFDEMKTEYETIMASDALKERINQTMKQFNENIEAIETKETTEEITNVTVLKHKKNPLRTYSTVAACLVMTFVLALNLSPAFAATVSHVPGMKNVVKVLTFGRYDAQENGYEAHIATPKIEGLLDKALEDKLNAEFKGDSAAVIAAFEADVKALKEEFPGETVHMGVDSGYEVRTDNDRYLVIDAWLLNTAGSSSTIHKYYTIDKHLQTQVTLASLFKENADYVTPLKKYLEDEMRRQNKELEVGYWIDDPDMMTADWITKDVKFFINNEGQLVICFDKYAIAPGAVGSPEFVIPNTVIQDLLK